MNIVVMDGQGGKLGRMLTEGILAKCPQARLTAIGTNTIATAAMIKGGAKRAATGENALLVACRTADVIVGPIGIVIADALYGEITPNMACAVAQSAATRILLPVSKCETHVVGIREDAGMQELVEEALTRIAALAEGTERE